MSVTTTKYVRKPLYVDAIRISPGNFDEVAVWCQGETQRDEPTGKGLGRPYIRVRVHNPRNPRQMRAYVGDWILYTDRGYKIYTNKAFQLAFDEVEEFVPATPEAIAQAVEENEAAREAEELEAQRGEGIASPAPRAA